MPEDIKVLVLDQSHLLQDWQDDFCRITPKRLHDAMPFYSVKTAFGASQ